jgi:outer membrane protein assembly factor BamB
MREERQYVVPTFRSAPPWLTLSTMRLFLLALIMLTTMAPLRAENWPQWRGPASIGVSTETGLPERWSDTENVAWKAPVRGLGISSPVVWGDQVFVTSQIGRSARKAGNHPSLVQGGNPADAGERALGGATAQADEKVSFLVTALSRIDGRKLWEYEVPAEGRLNEVHDKHNLASSSPVTDGRRVYAWFGTGQIVSLDMTGKLVWTRHLGKEYSPFDINWGHSSSPAIFNDSLILICYHDTDSYLLNLDAVSGKTKWRVDRGGTFNSYSTPLIVPIAGTHEIIVNSSDGVSGHNTANGELLWHIQETNRFPIPMAVFHDGTIYTSRGYRSGPYMAIRPGGKGDVSKTHVTWRVDTGAPYVSSLVHYNGLLYMAGDVGVLSAIDAKTGNRVWQERTGGVFTASPVAADGKIYLLSEDGQTIVLAAGPKPRVLARNRLNARQLASPAISGGRIFIRTDDAVIAIGK